MSTALLVVGYPLAVVVLTRWISVVRQRRFSWFVVHQLGVAAIVAGWALRDRWPAVAVNGAWFVSAAAWYAVAGRRQGRVVR